MPLHVFAEAALVLEARAEAGAVEVARRAAARCRRRCRCRRSAPWVTARFAAAVPRIAQKASSTSRHSGSLSCSARRVISGAAEAFVAHAGTIGQRAIDQFDARAGEQALETHVREMLPARIAGCGFRASSRGEKLAWPPSVPSAIQPCSAGISPDTPRPLPAPIRPCTLRGSRRAAADLASLVRQQAGQRHRQRGEIVDHHQVVEAAAARASRSIENCQW